MSNFSRSYNVMSVTTDDQKVSKRRKSKEEAVGGELLISLHYLLSVT